MGSRRNARAGAGERVSSRCAAAFLSESLTIAYRLSTLSALWPVIFIATERGTDSLSMFRTAERRRSCSPALAVALFHGSRSSSKSVAEGHHDPKIGAKVKQKRGALHLVNEARASW